MNEKVPTIEDALSLLRHFVFTTDTEEDLAIKVREAIMEPLQKLVECDSPIADSFTIGVPLKIVQGPGNISVRVNHLGVDVEGTVDIPLPVAVLLIAMAARIEAADSVIESLEKAATGGSDESASA